MRTAALPTFRKLYRIIDQTMPAGDYTVHIENSTFVAYFIFDASLQCHRGWREPFSPCPISTCCSPVFTPRSRFCLRHTSFRFMCSTSLRSTREPRSPASIYWVVYLLR